MSASPLSRLICSHDFYWSRKRQAEVCRRCGALTPVLSLHFRSRSAWTVGADLPPEHPVATPEEPAEVPVEDRPALSAPEAFALLAEAAPTFAPRAMTPDAAASPADSDPFTRPSASAPATDFSGRNAAPLLRPLVT